MKNIIHKKYINITQEPSLLKPSNLSINFIWFYIKKKKLNTENILISKQFNKDNLIFKFKTRLKEQLKIEKYSFCKNSILKLVSYFFKKGFFLKYLIIFLNIYSAIYSIFLNYKPESLLKSEEYIYILEFLYNLRYNKNLLNVNSLVY